MATTFSIPRPCARGRPILQQLQKLRRIAGILQPGYNFVGISIFPVWRYSIKVIYGHFPAGRFRAGGLWRGYHENVYVRRRIISLPRSPRDGSNYCGAALGTFAGSFYGNTTNYAFSGALLSNLAAYFAEGNNTLCLYNPSPSQSSQGYSKNYLQWNECTITITYEEPSSQPSMSATTVPMGSAVTIYTNRQSALATHTLRYSFFSVNETISTGVTDSVSWTPPVSLASQLPSSTSGWGTLMCDTYSPARWFPQKPAIYTDRAAFPRASITKPCLFGGGFGASPRNSEVMSKQSRLAVSLAAGRNIGSTITSYRTSLNGRYMRFSFTATT